MHNEIEPPDADESEYGCDQGYRLRLLSDIYLDAGLPLEFATRSAIADSELFQCEAVCA